MHIKILFAIIYSIFLASCGKKKYNNNTPKVHDTAIDSLKKKLLGKWGGGDNNPVFEIWSDSIHYFQKDSTYIYQLKGDTFKVKFLNRDTFTIFGKLKVIGDTLQIIDYNRSNFITYGYRIKN